MKIIKYRLFLSFVFFLMHAGYASPNQDEELALHHFMQGEFLMNQGNYSLAVLEFQDALDLDPNASTIHISIADAYRRLGKNKRAENHLRVALDLDPDEIEAIEMLGQIYIVQNNIIEAEIQFKNLSNRDPDNIDYLFTLADIARVQNKLISAIDYYISAYKINSLAINGLEQALQIALSANKFQKAEEVCGLLLEDDPGNINYLETLRDLCLFNQNYNKALSLIKNIEIIKGPSVDIFIQKSALLEELGDTDLALEALFDASKIDSMNLDVLNRLVSLLLVVKNNAEAIIYNQKIIENFPDDASGFINNAIMAMSSEKPDDVILSLNPHAKKFNHDYTIQYLLGTAYYQIKDYENAELYLSQALSIFPESRNAKHNLALIYDTLKKWDKSDNIYIELIASDSTDAQAHNNYAFSLVERDEDIEFALELAKTAIRLSPNSAPYLDTIGWIYYKLGNFDKAIDYVRDSMNIDKDNVTIREHMDEIIKAKAQGNIKKVQQVENQD